MRKKQKRLLALMMSIVLVLTLLHPASFAQQPGEEMISVSSDWQGSVFGDIGGQGNVTKDNFHVSENDDGTVTLRSANDRGKIASTSEGIAYYFKEIPENTDFEMMATAHVNAWTANDHVSFGIMLRGNVLENENDPAFSGNYLAVGALDQQMKAFYKQNDQVKSGLEFAAAPPSQEQEYQLSIRKSGGQYVISLGEETHTVEEFFW